ncbi:hypothetical protein PCC79_06145 [Propioniciclava soli]|uniref:Uncharacterized protein n=1 Tax=Propioniciclava soli TaxID=2775081 RepID=A0ABZ3CAG7_9ACTN
MHHPAQPPELVTDLSPTTWIEPRLEPWGWGRGVPVCSQVPTGFAVYLRLFHPAPDGRRWDRIAAQRYRFAHPLMQWEGLCRNQDEFVNGPMIGSLPEAEMRRLFGHLPSADEVYYAFWNGFGLDYVAAGLDPERPGRVLGQGRRIDSWRTPLLELPSRGYVVLRGPLHPLALVTRGQGDAPLEPEQSPNLIWPAEHTWFVATEIDHRFTLIGGDEALATALLDDPELEVVRVQPDDRIDYGGDTVNDKLPAWG